MYALNRQGMEMFLADFLLKNIEASFGRSLLILPFIS